MKNPIMPLFMPWQATTPRESRFGALAAIAANMMATPTVTRKIRPRTRAPVDVRTLRESSVAELTEAGGRAEAIGE